MRGGREEVFGLIKCVMRRLSGRGALQASEGANDRGITQTKISR